METGFKRNLLAELLDSVGRGALLMALGREEQERLLKGE